MTTYFTWPDRQFSYDCRGCGACCKGHGIGIDVTGGQLVQLVARRPELAAFVRRRGHAVTAFNPRDRCWFLTDDGLCRVEVEDGRAAKPASCRLFPFNRVFRLGADTIVDYNSVICPLVTVDDGGISHAEVLAEIATIADPAIVATQLPAKDPAGEHAFVETEAAIAATVFPAARRADLGVAWSAQQPGPIGSVIDATTAAFEAIVGVRWRSPNEPTLRAALFLTPSMRFNELYGPRQYTPRAKISPVLARMWLAWLGFAALGEQLAQRALGLQELTTLWTEQAPLLHAIARWSDIPALKPGPVELPSVDPQGLVRALGERCATNKARRPLGELVTQTFAAADPSTRVAALKLADAIVKAAFA
jgi:Fe-S-cluster containining protein